MTILDTLKECSKEQTLFTVNRDYSAAPGAINKGDISVYDRIDALKQRMTAVGKDVVIGGKPEQNMFHATMPSGLKMTDKDNVIEFSINSQNQPDMNKVKSDMHIIAAHMLDLGWGHHRMSEGSTYAGCGPYFEAFQQIFKERQAEHSKTHITTTDKEDFNAAVKAVVAMKNQMGG